VESTYLNRMISRQSLTIVLSDWEPPATDLYAFTTLSRRSPQIVQNLLGYLAGSEPKHS